MFKILCFFSSSQLKTFLLIALFSISNIELQAQVVSTIAGNGAAGSTSGQGIIASFKLPQGLTVDISGNIYVADYGNGNVRKITNTGLVSDFARITVKTSNGTLNLLSPTGIATDISGNVYVADYFGGVITKINPSCNVNVLAGTGSLGAKDGPGDSATFAFPTGIAVDKYGYVYVADASNNKIRKISPAGIVSTLAGTNATGSTDGVNNTATFNYPRGIALDDSGNVYVADSRNYKIRKISHNGFVSTLAGTGVSGNKDGIKDSATFSSPYGVVIDKAGNIFVTDGSNNKIRMISPTGIVSTFAGTGNKGNADGLASSSSFSFPFGIALDTAGNIFIADQNNNKIRKITNNVIITALNETEYHPNSIMVYPNPASDQINIALQKPVSGTISILDVQGRTLISTNIYGITTNLQVSELTTGMYILQISSDTLSLTQKINIIK